MTSLSESDETPLFGICACCGKACDAPLLDGAYCNEVCEAAAREDIEAYLTAKQRATGQEGVDQTGFGPSPDNLYKYGWGTPVVDQWIRDTYRRWGWK